VIVPRKHIPNVQVFCMLQGLFVPDSLSGTALTKEECVAPPVLAIVHARYPALARWANV